MGKIRVIVAEAPAGSTQPRGLLRAVLEREGVEVAGEVFSLDELVELAADEQPDAVVFADAAPRDELARVQRVSPATKIVLVSPILTAAEAELATAVVERTDVLRSLGPVLVLLCTPGRASARRTITESFDRPDWIDRVRKDPATLRDMLSADPPHDVQERPSVTSLQGEVRASELTEIAESDTAPIVLVPEPDPLDRTQPIVHLPDTEDVTGGSGGTVSAAAVDAGNRRAQSWVLTAAVTGVVLVGFALGSGRIPTSVVRTGGEGVDPPAVETVSDGSRTGPGTRAPGVVGSRRLEGTDRDASPVAPTGDGSRSPAGGGDPGADPGTDPGTDPGGDPGTDPGTDPDDATPGSSGERNPHGGPPGRSGVHPSGKDHPKP